MMDPSIVHLLGENKRLKEQHEVDQAYIAELRTPEMDRGESLLLEENEQLLKQHKEDQMTIEKLRATIQLLQNGIEKDGDYEEDVAAGVDDEDANEVMMEHEQDCDETTQARLECVESMEQAFHHIQMMRGNYTEWNDPLEMMASVQEKMRIVIWELDQEREELNREIQRLKANITTLEERNDLQAAKIDILTRTIREELDEKWHKVLEEKQTSRSSLFSFPFLRSTSSSQSERTMDETVVADISHEGEVDSSCAVSDDIESCLDRDDTEVSECELIDSNTGHLLDQMIHLTSHSSDAERSVDKEDLSGLENCSVEFFSALPTKEILDSLIDLTADHEAEADSRKANTPAKNKLFQSLKGNWRTKKDKC